TRRTEILPTDEPVRQSVMPAQSEEPYISQRQRMQAPETQAVSDTALMESESAIATAVITESAPQVEESQDAIHSKAKRFAKLLVEEIKLYNGQKVEDGRAHRDLYDRLREDIEKSRASFDKRYATTQVADADYFNKELVRILADNDAALLGNGFP